MNPQRSEALTSIPAAAPVDAGIEASVLGLLLHGSVSVRARILADVEASDFHAGMNAPIFVGVAAVVMDEPDADATVVLSRLVQEPAHRGATDVRVWQVALSDLAVLRADVMMSELYVKQLRDVSARRRLWDAGAAQMRAAHDAVTVADAQEASSRSVFEAITRDDPASRRISSAASVSSFESWYTSEDAAGDAIPYPIRTLNDSIGVQRSPMVIVTGGYSGDGKTWFGLDCMESACAAGARTAFFSIEMSDRELSERLIAMGGVNYTALQNRAIPSMRFAERAAHVAAMDRVTFPGSWTSDGVRLELGRAQAEGRPFKYVVVDHLHILDVPGRAAEYRINLNKALAAFKGMAQEFGCVIHLLAQLSRQGGVGGPFPDPHMGMLKESGGIEQIADRVIFVHRTRDSSNRTTEFGQVIVGKARSAKSTAAIPVEFTRQYRFRELAS